MKEINNSVEARLLRTHESFWPEQIQSITDKAFRVRIVTRVDYRIVVVWLPKSKLLRTTVIDKRTYLVEQGCRIGNPDYGKARFKYFIPKFFTKPQFTNHK